MARRALVTGATGFVGGRLAAALADRGWAVRCLVRDRSRAQGLADRGFELHEADVLDARGAARGRRGRRDRLLPDSRDGARDRPGRVRGTRAAGRAELRRDGEAGGSRPGRLPGRAGRPPGVGAPAQPPPDRRDPLRTGAPTHLLPGRDDRRGGERVLPHAALSRAAASRDDRPGVAQDAHAGDRDRRRDRLPGGGRPTSPPQRAARCRSQVPTSSPTARCSI